MCHSGMPLWQYMPTGTILGCAIETPLLLVLVSIKTVPSIHMQLASSIFLDQPKFEANVGCAEMKWTSSLENLKEFLPAFNSISTGMCILHASILTVILLIKCYILLQSLQFWHAKLQSCVVRCVES